MTRRIFLSMLLFAGGIFLSILLAFLGISALIGVEACLPYLIVLSLLFLAVIPAAWLIAKAIVRPLRNVDPDAAAAGEPLSIHYDELTPLFHLISHQNDKIDRQTDELGQKSIELALIMENMTEGFIILDDRGRVISHNRSAVRLLDELPDFSRRPLVRTVLEGKHGEEMVHLGDEVFQLIANPVTEEDDIHLTRTIRGAVVVVLDVTERQMREQLRHEFTSNVSHELKTPLTTIYGISDMLDGGIVKPEDSGKFIRDIRTEASRLISLIDDIIKLSQLDENGNNTLSCDEVDLTELASGIIHRLSVAAEGKNVTFQLIGEHLVYSGVRAVLDEMIYNLCDNAIKYNRDGGKVYVSVYRDGSHACISVEDTGIGIPQKDQGRVFERFYRVDKSHSRKIGGTGLGLSIVKHGALYHGGTVSLTSTEGVGTKVVITL